MLLNYIKIALRNIVRQKSYTLIAFPVAWYLMNDWLGNFAYHTDAQGWIFIGAAVLALSIALITVSWQAIKAATNNPVNALKYE